MINDKPANYQDRTWSLSIARRDRGTVRVGGGWKGGNQRGPREPACIQFMLYIDYDSLRAVPANTDDYLNDYVDNAPATVTN